MKKLLFFVLVCGVMSSCDYTNRYDLPKDKIPLLKNNDIVYFKDSASSKVDTLSLEIDDYWKDSYEGDKYRVISVFYQKIKRKNPLLTYGVIADKKIVAGFGVVYYKNEPIGYDKTSNILTYTILGVNYPSVYFSQSITPDTIPNKVYFTCQNGIIRYEYKDGRVYNLLSK